jgi:hypothetical protein
MGGGCNVCLIKRDSGEYDFGAMHGWRKQVYLAFFTLVWGIFLGCATNLSEQTLKENPALRPADGSKSVIEWTEQEGDDFVVFYGDIRSAPQGGAGIYRGNEPTFRKPKNATPIKGKLGVFDVDWYPMKDKGARFYRTCLIDYQKRYSKADPKKVTLVIRRHVWVYADTEEGLERVIAEVGKLTMFANRPPDMTE